MDNTASKIAPIKEDARPRVSVVCPFFNEEAILENAIRGMLDYLVSLPCEWELILVNDGSRDGSAAIAEQALVEHSNARLISYTHNQGRGHALRTGIDAAQGEIILTTECDLSWGEDIVERILNKFSEFPETEVVVASPNLPEGGYKNVPAKRVYISRLGNQILRTFFSRKISMYTGMTRGYRREVVQSLITEEKGKEFHLEVLSKLMLLEHKIREVPAILEWKDKQLAKPNAKQRKSSSKIPKLIASHIHFAVFANPLRYFWALSLVTFIGAVGFLVTGVIRLSLGQVSVYMALMSVALGVFSLLFFGIGILAAQNIKIMKSLWRR